MLRTAALAIGAPAASEQGGHENGRERGGTGHVSAGEAAGCDDGLAERRVHVRISAKLPPRSLGGCSRRFGLRQGIRDSIVDLFEPDERQLLPRAFRDLLEIPSIACR